MNHGSGKRERRNHFGAGTPPSFGTATSDPSTKQIYRVSLAGGIIEQTLQRNNSVTATYLTCPAGATVFLNPINSPAFYHYDNDCAGTSEFVGSNSNPQGEAALDFWWFADSSTKNLESRLTTCVVAKVGTQAAQVPFTGRVLSSWGGFLYGCGAHFCSTTFNAYGEVCSPVMLAGVPIGRLDNPLAPPCQTSRSAPFSSSTGEFKWSANSHGIDGYERHAVGSFGGAWMTSST